MVMLIAIGVLVLLWRQQAAPASVSRRGARRLTLVAVVCPVVAGLALPAMAANYTFTNIADSTGEWRQFDIPSINSGGTVAFSARIATPGPPDGMFTGTGGPLTTIADDSGPLGAIGHSGSLSSINPGGTVAFRAVRDGDAGEWTGGIFTGSGGPITTVAHVSGQFSSFRGLGFLPAINTGGTVAFHATLDAGGEGIFTGSGGPTSTIADSSGPFSTFVNFPSINTGGTVAFFARLDAGGNGIFIGSGGPTTTIADTSGPFSGFGGTPSINTGGTVAFDAFLDTGARGIFTGSGGPITTIADNSGPFSTFIRPWINNAGTVVFYADLAPSGHGIFTGDGGSTSKVIRTGDPLFGSTVAEVIIGGPSLNDNGDVAFRYFLANGVDGIAIARIIPEPASLALLLAGLIAMFLHRPAATPKHRRLVGVAIVKPFPRFQGGGAR